MTMKLSNAPANRAYDVFRTLFDSEEDLAAWLWKHKGKIVPDCIYWDGTDGRKKEYVDVIKTEDPKTGELTVLDEMPSIVTVRGIGTHRELAEFHWIVGQDKAPFGTSKLHQSEARSYDVTLADYQKWARANGIRSGMPIMKK
jgi:hypothetical protein